MTYLFDTLTGRIQCDPYRTAQHHSYLLFDPDDRSIIPVTLYWEYPMVPVRMSDSARQENIEQVQKYVASKMDILDTVKDIDFLIPGDWKINILAKLPVVEEDLHIESAQLPTDYNGPNFHGWTLHVAFHGHAIDIPIKSIMKLPV